MDVVSEINEIKRRLTRLESQVLKLERTVRKNNILIYGLITKNLRFTSLVDVVLYTLNSLLGLAITLSDISNLSTMQDDQIVRVEFCSFLTRQLVLDNVYKIKDHQRVLITKDRCPQERLYFEALQRELNASAAQGLNARISGLRLIVTRDDCPAPEPVPSTSGVDLRKRPVETTDPEEEAKRQKTD